MSELENLSNNKLVKFLINYHVEEQNKVRQGIHERLSWDDYFLCHALTTSFRSPSSKLQVGAVIVRDHRIICTGYNGYFPGTPHIPIHVNNHEMNTVHAEQNAIAEAAKRGVSIDQATMYITHYPCLNCAKMILASGIKEVKYLNLYKPDPIVKDLFDQVQVNLQPILS